MYKMFIYDEAGYAHYEAIDSGSPPRRHRAR